MCFFYKKKLVRPSFMIRGTIMTTNQLMFMYAVEEMSFSKAAQKAFVTQQCLSNHIHRLEVSCGVKLFERTPHLQLTEAGKTLYQSFIQIRDIEEGTLQKLKTDTSSIHGTIRFGTHLNRARIFLIDPFLEFHEKYPDVELDVYFIHSAYTEKVLDEGTADVILGANCTALANTRADRIGEEDIVFLASPDLLKERIPDWDESRKTLTRKELSMIPLTASSNISIMAQNLHRTMLKAGFESKYIFKIEDNNAQMAICKSGKAAMFCPENQLIKADLSCHSEISSSAKLQVLKLENYSDFMSIDLITSAQRNLPTYVTDFCSMIRTYYQDQIQKVRAEYLPWSNNQYYSEITLH